VGLSTGGGEDGGGANAPANNPPLARLPNDFRTSWTKAAPRFSSEHAQLEADLYVDPASCADAVHGKPMTGACRFAEELFRRDAGVGIYLLEHGDAGARFAVGDARGRTVADDAWDGGAAALDACARCHSEAPRSGVFAAPR